MPFIVLVYKLQFLMIIFKNNSIQKRIHIVVPIVRFSREMSNDFVCVCFSSIMKKQLVDPLTLIFDEFPLFLLYFIVYRLC